MGTMYRVGTGIATGQVRLIMNEVSGRDHEAPAQTALPWKQHRDINIVESTQQSSSHHV